MLWYKNEVGVESNEEKVDVEDDTNDEDTNDVNVDSERERHWRMVFEENGGGVDDKEASLHAKRWDVYVN